MLFISPLFYILFTPLFWFTRMARVRFQLIAVVLVGSVSSASFVAPRVPISARRSKAAGSLNAAGSLLHCSLLDEEPRRERLALVAERHGLDPERDWRQVAAIAASSLPEEENGTWADVGMCTLRNACAIGLILAVVGALPGQASASEVQLAPTFAAIPSIILASEESDVFAIIAVPLLAGGVLVAIAASQYENLIDKLNGR